MHVTESAGECRCGGSVESAGVESAGVESAGMATVRRVGSIRLYVELS